MKRKSKPSSNRYRRAGLTFIEVIASSALLGVLLVAVLLAMSAHTRQIRASEQRMSVLHATDLLIAGWFAAGDPIPRNAKGKFPDLEQCYWQTESLGGAGLSPAWRCEKVSLVVFKADDRSEPRELFRVELIDTVRDIPAENAGKSSTDGDANPGVGSSTQ
jgi:type II secretory pathway pseudopilin PulG